MLMRERSRAVTSTPSASSTCRTRSSATAATPLKHGPHWPALSPAGRRRSWPSLRSRRCSRALRSGFRLPALLPTSSAGGDRPVALGTTPRESTRRSSRRPAPSPAGSGGHMPPPRHSGKSPWPPPRPRRLPQRRSRSSTSFPEREAAPDCETMHPRSARSGRDGRASRRSAPVWAARRHRAEGPRRNRERADGTAIQPVDDRRLLTPDIPRWPLMDARLDPIEPGRWRSATARVNRVHSVRTVPPHRHHHRVGAHLGRGQSRSVQHQVRGNRQQIPVFRARGLALHPVHHHDRPAAAPPHGVELASGRKARPAPADQSRPLDRRPRGVAYAAVPGSP